METIINIEKIIGSKAADDDTKGNLVFEEILTKCKEYIGDIVLDFSNIELVNTAFLNNAVGQLFDRKRFDLLKNAVTVRNMNNSMIDLLRETISLAHEKYS